MRFITKTGEELEGTIVYAYSAFEGGIRYVIESNGRQYRCVKDGDRYVEYVVQGEKQ